MIGIEAMCSKIDEFIADHISAKAPNGWTWEEWYALADLTTKMNWDCQFIDGACKANRAEMIDKVSCCCYGCQHSYGYLRAIPSAYAKTIKAAWNPVTGFCRDKTGCALPRRLRSAICLEFNCREPSPGMEMFERLSLGLGLPSGMLDGHVTKPLTPLEQLEVVRKQLVEEGVIK